MSPSSIDYQLAYMQTLFDKIKAKKTESYVIHRIWDKLDDTRILFKTQQWIELPEGRYALADLYLPQLDIFIEINEPYHERQKEKDYHRNEDIVKQTGIKPYYINCGEIIHGVAKWRRLCEIHRQIDECVAFIKQHIADKEKIEKLTPWDISEGLSIAYHKNKGHLNAERNDALSTIDDICVLFDTVPKKRGFLRMGVADIPGKSNVELWFPILKNNKNWDNQLSEDKDVFVERHKDLNRNKQHIVNLLREHRRRVTFFKEKDVLGMDVYHFLGIYDLNEEKSQRQNACVWERTEKIYDLLNRESS